MPSWSTAYTISPRTRRRPWSSVRRPHALHHRRADPDQRQDSEQGGRRRHDGLALAGFQLENGTERSYGNLSDAAKSKALDYAADMAARFSVKTVDRATFETCERTPRTTYVLDVRSQAEYEAGHMPGSVFAPGGQLVQSSINGAAPRAGSS